jgi:RHS repeat-associated protein
MLTTERHRYDLIGQLIVDDHENISNIEWDHRHKIRHIQRDANITDSDLEFRYDAGGLRVTKIAKPRTGGSIDPTGADWSYTYYFLDPQGNAMTMYKLNNNNGTKELRLIENNIYGSKRTGQVQRQQLLASYSTGTGAVQAPDPNITIDGITTTAKHTSGDKSYEIANHLGNVLATLSDRRVAVDEASYHSFTGGYVSSGPDGEADAFAPDVLSYSDYYAFGMQMPGRNGGEDYRYAFNGMEHDPEVSGDGNSYEFGARRYDPRLGKWLKTDNHASSYPSISPYSFAANNPIYNVDPDGNDIWGYLALRAAQYATALDVTSSSQTFISILSLYQDMTLGDQVTPLNQARGGGALEAVNLTFTVQASPVIDPTDPGNTLNGLTTVNLPIVAAGVNPPLSQIGINIDLSPLNATLQDGDRIVTVAHEGGLHLATFSKLLLKYKAYLSDPSSSNYDYAQMTAEMALVNNADHYSAKMRGHKQFEKVLSEVEATIATNYSNNFVSTGLPGVTSNNALTTLMTPGPTMSLVSQYSGAGIDLMNDIAFVPLTVNRSIPTLASGAQAPVFYNNISLLNSFRWAMNLHEQNMAPSPTAVVPSLIDP